MTEAPRAGACSRLVWELVKRTSVDGDMEEPQVVLGDRALFEHPFVVLFGETAFPLPTQAELEQLRRYLIAGGLLLADSCGAAGDEGFDRSFRRLMGRVFPDTSLKVLKPQHTVYRSFYLLDRPYGRVQLKPHLEGISRDDLSPVIYSRNDLPGAWMRDRYGSWVYDVSPGGEQQREMSFRLGVNLSMYALTLNYKRDQVHVPFLLKKRRWRDRHPPRP